MNYTQHKFPYRAFLVMSESVLILQPAITGMAQAAIGYDKNFKKM